MGELSQFFAIPLYAVTTIPDFHGGPPAPQLATELWPWHRFFGAKSSLSGYPNLRKWAQVLVVTIKVFRKGKGHTPQKSNIDTKNCHFSRELPFPNHHFGVSFRRCIISFNPYDHALCKKHQETRSPITAHTIPGRESAEGVLKLLFWMTQLNIQIFSNGCRTHIESLTISAALPSLKLT